MNVYVKSLFLLLDLYLSPVLRIYETYKLYIPLEVLRLMIYLVFLF